MCWRLTEFEIADEARAVYKVTNAQNVAVRAVPITNDIREEAQREANRLVERYEQALNGEFGPFEAGSMLSTYCDVMEMRGDFSLDSFRDQVERRTLIAVWASRGKILSASRMPNQLKGNPKPSKLFCEMHNPGRSPEARRGYQRDRRFKLYYEKLISTLWSLYADELPAWDIEAHTAVRREAYRLLQGSKSMKSEVAELLSDGALNQSQIARRLGMSRQGVSAAIKRGALKHSKCQ